METETWWEALDSEWLQLEKDILAFLTPLTSTFSLTRVTASTRVLKFFPAVANSSFFQPASPTLSIHSNLLPNLPVNLSPSLLRVPYVPNSSSTSMSTHIGPYARIRTNSHLHLTKWPKPYTASAIVQGFHYMDYLRLCTSSRAGLVVEEAFHRAFPDAVYVKSTYSYTRRIFRSVEATTLLSMFVAGGDSEDMLWSTFVRAARKQGLVTC